MLDLLIEGGTLVDGSGAPPRIANVAVAGGKIVAVGPEVRGDAAETIDASGLVVTPGFVDIHTHYDGQVTWDDAILPSTAHGVTTVVQGNCGVGFAPVRPGFEEWLLGLMEGVEDIPGAALHEGIHWSWETFPEYLDALDRRRFAADVATQLPYGALRVYVMGERGATDAAATGEELAAIAALVREAIEAGALGVGANRTRINQGIDGRPVPGTFAEAEEVLAVGRAMREGGGGVWAIVNGGFAGDEDVARLAGQAERWTADEELALMRRFADETGERVTFTASQRSVDPRRFEYVMARAEELYGGLPVHPQFAGRPTGVLTGLQTYHALMNRPSYRAIAALALDQRVQRMREPAVRAAILSEIDAPLAGRSSQARLPLFLRALLPMTFPLGERLDYEPDPAAAVGARAAASGVSADEALYDLLLEQEGRAMLVAYTSNYASGDLRVVERMLHHPKSVLGLGDAGAHVRYICDASVPTFMLSHWTRDRSRGPKAPIELVVKKLAADGAGLYGLCDRGTIEPGKRADLNVVDLASVRLGPPRLAADLPGGAERLLQDAAGYVLTLVAGVAVRRNDRDTGARPGRLVRGRRAA